MKEFKYKVYVKLDKNNCIITVESDLILKDTKGYLQIDEGIGDKYSHAQGNYLNKGLVDSNGKYNYKYVDNQLVELTEEEKELLFPVEQPKPTEMELLKQQLLETQATLAEMQYNNLLNNGGIQ